MKLTAETIKEKFGVILGNQQFVKYGVTLQCFYCFNMQESIERQPDGSYKFEPIHAPDCRYETNK